MTREQRIAEAYDRVLAARDRTLQAEAKQKAARKAVSDADKEHWAAVEAESAAIRILLGLES